jgi:hypothetical protein
MPKKGSTAGPEAGVELPLDGSHWPPDKVLEHYRSVPGFTKKVLATAATWSEIGCAVEYFDLNARPIKLIRKRLTPEILQREAPIDIDTLKLVPLYPSQWLPKDHVVMFCEPDVRKFVRKFWPEATAEPLSESSSEPPPKRTRKDWVVHVPQRGREKIKAWARRVSDVTKEGGEEGFSPESIETRIHEMQREERAAQATARATKKLRRSPLA